MVSWDSANISQQGEAGGVVLVNPDDDVSTEWVDVLIPGIGLCQVQRTNLVMCDHVRDSEVQPGLALELHISDGPHRQHLTTFLNLVGQHLCSLWIESEFPLLGGWDSRSSRVLSASAGINSAQGLTRQRVQLCPSVRTVQHATLSSGLLFRQHWPSGGGFEQ